ncbi:ABC transporter ATP-binding protein [Candidatus Similichlamydia laticola]|uniref:Methionine ABC transporter ATP-binding protein n=1 Tax=Candidatus Similichlamydia laticola TaxID=2170265 RepID=A0A369KCK2_9BACT|nr:ATP-binding cassette domain-containing protein [Candidatus Similichlamydia laticola]RDB31638.1 Methionine ABC transporter ATP-binding protein [Candidatus Similichlamydia laticola]
MTSCIDLENIHKRYGEHQVLNGLSLGVSRGETVVIMGRSGEGKSVLLKHILGLERPDQGNINLFGVDIWKCSKLERAHCLRHIGMLFQNSALFDSMSVWENVAFPLTVRNYQGIQSPRESKSGDRIAWALKRVGMLHAADKLPWELSGGMRKRAALARVIVYHPTVILYDEPTTGLDPITAMQINELILDVQREFCATSVVVTHDLNSAATIGNRIGFHENGQVQILLERDQFFKCELPSVQNFLNNSCPPIIKQTFGF